MKKFAFNFILLWFCLLKADMWLVLKYGLKVMCFKLIIKSCLHPAVFKAVYKSAEVAEMVMECGPRRWDAVICCVQFCSWSCTFWWDAVPQYRLARTTMCKGRVPTLYVWHSSHHKLFKMPLLSRFSAILGDRISCFGRSAR